LSILGLDITSLLPFRCLLSFYFLLSCIIFLESLRKIFQKSDKP
jgi:hypothetical protein